MYVLQYELCVRKFFSKLKIIRIIKWKMKVKDKIKWKMTFHRYILMLLKSIYKELPVIFFNLFKPDLVYHLSRNRFLLIWFP